MTDAMVTRGDVYVARREVLQVLTVDVAATVLLPVLVFTGVVHLPFVMTGWFIGYLVTKVFLVRACWKLVKTGPLPPPVAFAAAFGILGTIAAGALAYASGKALKPADHS